MSNDLYKAFEFSMAVCTVIMCVVLLCWAFCMQYPRVWDLQFNTGYDIKAFALAMTVKPKKGYWEVWMKLCSNQGLWWDNLNR